MILKELAILSVIKTISLLVMVQGSNHTRLKTSQPTVISIRCSCVKTEPKYSKAWALQALHSKISLNVCS